MSSWTRYTTRRGKTPQRIPREIDEVKGRAFGADFLLLFSVGCRYNDDHYEYRHVQLPKAMLKKIPKDYFDGSRGTLKLLWEDEWRGLGITQVSGTPHHTKLSVVVMG